MPARLDPESLAVEAMLRLASEIEARASGKCKSLAVRAADLPQLLAQTGLVATALFYISKSDERLYAELLGKLAPAQGQPQEPPQQGRGERDPLPDECGSEGKGYTLGLALLAHAIAAMGSAGLLGKDLSARCNWDSIGGFKGLASCILGIREARSDLKAERILAAYLTSVKRLSEALYKEKEG